MNKNISLKTALLVVVLVVVGFIASVIVWGVADSKGGPGVSQATPVKATSVSTPVCAQKLYHPGETVESPTISLKLVSVTPFTHQPQTTGTITEPGTTETLKMLRAQYLATNKTDTTIDTGTTFNDGPLIYELNGVWVEGAPVIIEPIYPGQKTNTDPLQPGEKRTVRFNVLDGSRVVLPVMTSTRPLFTKPGPNDCPPDAWQLKP